MRLEEKNRISKKSDSLLTLDEVLDSTKGIYVLGSGDFFFSSVQTDSRKIEEDSLFVPLIGENQDGHKYIPQAIEKGASVVFIDIRRFEEDGEFFRGISLDNPEVIFIAVDNTMYALQDAARKYVEKFPKLIKVGITGSSGKTTTKEFAASILSTKYKVITNEGNLNSETGLPLSVFKIRADHEIGIFEMGMNRRGEIEEIAAVFKPKFCIVTNIGSAHIGRLGSRENIAEEKSKIFDHINNFGVGFIPKKDDFSEYLASKVDGKVIFYGDAENPRIRHIKDCGLYGTEIEVDGCKAVLSVPGKYNYLNLLSVIELAFVLGLDREQIVEGIKLIKPMFGRTEILHGKYTIVQDCYNANPDSMEKAIDFVSGVSSDKHKIFVLGDMLELGESSALDHMNVGNQVASSSADVVFFVGKEMLNAYKKALEAAGSEKKLYHFEETTDESMKKISDAIKDHANCDDIIFVKGSRGVGLERVVSFLRGEII